MFLSRIIVYPIKSLNGVTVKEAKITPGGILQFDRIYAMVDKAGAFVNGKRTPRVQLLRADFSPDFMEIVIYKTDQVGQTKGDHFLLLNPAPLNQWLTDFFGFAVSLVTEVESGFPDDRTAFGPTVTSEASLREVAQWYPDLSLENVRRRFRSNLELAGGEPFWEDRLFGKPGELKLFQIGDVKFLGHNPCQRCVVPTRDPDRADPIPNFQKIFMERRKQTFSSWAEVERFNHYYRFAVNTSVSPMEAGKLVQAGAPVLLLNASKSTNNKY